MRVKAAAPSAAATYLNFPVTTVPAVWEAFARQADSGAARWGALVNQPEVVAAQPPPQLPKDAGARACVRACVRACADAARARAAGAHTHTHTMVRAAADADVTCCAVCVRAPAPKTHARADLRLFGPSAQPAPRGMEATAPNTQHADAAGAATKTER
jgi:hypothetical protein